MGSSHITLATLFVKLSEACPDCALLETKPKTVACHVDHTSTKEGRAIQVGECMTEDMHVLRVKVLDMLGSGTGHCPCSCWGRQPE